MNEQSVDAITTPCPNKRQQWARYIAAQVQADYPHMRRADERYVWSEVLILSLRNDTFRLWMLSKSENAARRLVMLARDIWSYRLDNR